MSDSALTTSSSRSVFALRLGIVAFCIALAWPLLRTVVAESLISRSNLYVIYGHTHDAERYLRRAAWIDPDDGRLAEARGFIALTKDPKQMLAARDALLPLASQHHEYGLLWRDIAIMDTRLHDYPAARSAIAIAQVTLHDPTTKRFADVLNRKR